MNKLSNDIIYRTINFKTLYFISNKDNATKSNLASTELRYISHIFIIL